MRLPSLIELEFNRLPNKAKKNAITYLNHRVKSLSKTLAKCETTEAFSLYGDFVFGRKIEAEHMLDVIKYLKKKT
jgi:hypothetical protein